jgi:hypothetical protein
MDNKARSKPGVSFARKLARGTSNPVDANLVWGEGNILGIPVAHPNLKSYR